MWSLFEFLFVVDPSNKKKSVLDYAIPYICQFYLKNLSWRTRDLLKNYVAENKTLLEKIEDKYGKEATDNVKKEAKLHFLIRYLAEDKAEACNIYSGKVLEQRYIGLVNKLMQLRGKKLWLSDYIQNLENQVKSDLLRAYRIRNILAHQASIDERFLDEIYDVITYYLKLILDDLLYSMKLQPNNSVHDIVKIRRESYKDYLKSLGNITSSSEIPYRKLITTKSLLV